MNIIGKRLYYYIFSGLLIAASVLAVVFWGLKPGTDYTGGTLLEVGINKGVDAKIVKEALKDMDLPELSVNSTGKNSVQIKTSQTDTSKTKEVVPTLKQNLAGNKEQGISEVNLLQSQTIGPTVGKDLTKRAIIAVCVAIIAISFYIAWSFRKVQKPFSSWSMSIATVIALTHDIIVTLGFVATINHFYGFEANSYLLVALITILGFSMHDTIVVFDRIRENILHLPAQEPIVKTVNDSVNQTLARSINTSMTAILVLLALAVIGGGAIRPFVLTLLMGIAIGTYSSIFVASPVLVTWVHMRRNRGVSA